MSVGCKQAMTISGAGIFYDGITAARHNVTVEPDPAALRIRAADGTTVAEWRYDEIEPLSAPEGVLADRPRQKSRTRAARSARCRTGRGNRRSVDSGRPQRPLGTPHA